MGKIVSRRKPVSPREALWAHNRRFPRSRLTVGHFEKLFAVTKPKTALKEVAQQVGVERKTARQMLYSARLRKPGELRKIADQNNRKRLGIGNLFDGEIESAIVAGLRDKTKTITQIAKIAGVSVPTVRKVNAQRKIRKDARSDGQRLRKLGTRGKPFNEQNAREKTNRFLLPRLNSAQPKFFDRWAAELQLPKTVVQRWFAELAFETDRLDILEVQEKTGWPMAELEKIQESVFKRRKKTG